MKFNRLASIALVLVGTVALSACAPKMQETVMDDVKEKQTVVEEQKIEETEAEEEMKQEEVKQDKPSYIVKSFDGEEVNLFDGQKTYVKVWASWCSVCLSGLDELNELYGSETDFRVISVVAPDQFGEMSEEKLIEWWQGLESDYPNIEIFMDMEGEFFTDARVRAFPTSYYIDSNDEIVGSAIGHNTNEAIFEKMKDVE